MNPWNDATLMPPPVHTFKSEHEIDVNQLRYTCDCIIKVLSTQSPLHREAAISSRFLYKFDKKFRHDIGYRSLKKVNTALRKYLALEMFKHVENFIAMLPSIDDERVYLPTRQMLEYIMLRLITFSKIMMRISITSKQAAILYMDRVKRGESHWMSFMPYALLCRIWSLSMVLLQNSCRWYKQLFPFLVQLQLKGLNFLPAGYELPRRVEELIDLNELDCMGKFTWTVKKKATFEYLIPEDDEGDILTNILAFVNQINEVVPEEDSKDDDEMLSNTPIEVPMVSGDKKPTFSADQGQKISREMFKSFYGVQSLKVHSAELITNKESLKQFIILEDKLRNESSMKSLTTHLTFMQWHALKNSLETLTLSLSNNRKIEKKFKKIWKEKCLDYK